MECLSVSISIFDNNGNENRKRNKSIIILLHIVWNNFLFSFKKNISIGVVFTFHSHPGLSHPNIRMNEKNKSSYWEV